MSEVYLPSTKVQRHAEFMLEASPMLVPPLVADLRSLRRAGLATQRRLGVPALRPLRDIDIIVSSENTYLDRAQSFKSSTSVSAHERAQKCD